MLDPTRAKVAKAPSLRVGVNTHI